MLAVTEKLLETGFRDQVIKTGDLASVLRGTPASRYALINKALIKGEIVRLKRDVYVLATKYRSSNISQFFLANQIVSDSFISFETALSFHGWIPEKVNVVMSVLFKGRAKSFNTAFGSFQYNKIPVNEYEFLSGVFRKELNTKPFLIANPLRALADYVYMRGVKWTSLDFLVEGLRIEIEDLETLTSKDFDEIIPIYRSKRVLSFLHRFRGVLGK